MKALLIDLSCVPGNALMKFGEEMAAILTSINARQDGRLAVVLSQDNPFYEKLRTYGLLGSDFLRVRSSETEAMRATTGTEPERPLNWQRAEDLLLSLQAKSGSRFNQKNLGDFSFQPKELLTTTIQKSDTTWIITPRGTMLSEERAGWDDFCQVLQEAKDHPAPLQVIIDFTFCPNLDSYAIGFLLSTQRGLRAFGHTLVLKNLSTEIQLKLQTKRLDTIFAIE